MHDRPDAMVAQRCLYQRLVGYVAFDEGDICGYRPAKAGNEVVDDDHAITGVAQRQHRMAADIARAARNEDIGLVVHEKDRKSTRLNSSHSCASRMPSSA